MTADPSMEIVTFVWPLRSKWNVGGGKNRGTQVSFPGGDKRNLIRRALGFVGFSALAGAASLRGGKVDAVMESVGDATWAHSLRSLRPGGRVVVCGATSGPNPPADLNRVFFLQLQVLGSTMGT